jgi:hypothetical protein
MATPNWEKYPAIWEEFEKVRTALKPLEEKRAKEMAKVNSIQEEIQALVDKKDAAHEKACADLYEIRRLRHEEARLARAMGAESA